MPELTPQQKAQLDSNIRAMISKGASQEDVMAYSKDYRTKYDIPIVEPTLKKEPSQDIADIFSTTQKLASDLSSPTQSKLPLQKEDKVTVTIDDEKPSGIDIFTKGYKATPEEEARIAHESNVEQLKQTTEFQKDPIKTATNFLVSDLRKNQLKSKQPSESTAQQFLPPTQQGKSEEKVNEFNIQPLINDVKKKMFPTEQSALDWVYKEGHQEKIDEYLKTGKLPNNETDKQALTVLNEYEDIKSVIKNSGGDLKKAAVDYYSSKDPQLSAMAKEGIMPPDETQQRLLGQFLKEPKVKELAYKDKDLHQLYGETKFNFKQNNPDAWKNDIVAQIAQGRQDYGFNNPILNFTGVNSSDQVINKLFEDKKIDRFDVEKYYKEVRPLIATHAIDMPTPGFIEGGVKSAVSGISDLPKAITELTGIRNLYTTAGERTFERMQDEEKAIPFKPKGFLNQVGYHGGNLAGFVIPIGGEAKVLQATGLIKNAVKANEFATVLNFYHGIYLDNERNNPEGGIINNISAAVQAYSFVKLTPFIGKIAAAPIKESTPIIQGILKKLESGSIEAAAAQEQITKTITDKVIDWAKKAPTKAGNIAKETLSGAGQMVIGQAVSDAIGGVFTGKYNTEESFQKSTKAGISMLWGLPLLHMVKPSGGNREGLGSIMYEMTGKPEETMANIKEASKDPEFAKIAPEVVENFNHAVDVRELLDGKEGMSQKDKEKFLLTETHKKILEKQIKNSPSKILNADKEKEVAILDIEQKIIIDPDINNTKIVQEFFENDLLGKSSKENLSIRDEDGRPTNKFDPSKVGEYIKEAAQRINNLDSDWKPNTLGNSSKSARESYPEAIQKIAEKRWKKEIEAAQPQDKATVSTDQATTVSMGDEKILADNADLMRDVLDEFSIDKDGGSLTFLEKDNIHKGINDYEAGKISGEELKKSFIENGVDENYLSKKMVENGMAKNLELPASKEQPIVNKASDVVEGKPEIKTETNETPDTKGSNEGAEPVKPEKKIQPPEPPIEGGKTAEAGTGEPPPEGEVKIVEDVEGQDLSGIKKALVSDEIIKGVDLNRIGYKEAMKLGRKILDTGEVKPEALVTKIITDGKGVLTPTEVVGLITYKRDIDTAANDLYAKYNEKVAAGEDTGTLGVEIANLERQINDFEVMSVITAQQQSLAFGLRQMMLDRDYNSVMQIAKYKKNNNGYIPPEVEAKFRELEKELKEVKAKLTEAEKKQADKEGQEAVDNIKESVDREKKYTEAELQEQLRKERASSRAAKKEKVYKAIDETMAKWAKKLSADLPPGTQKQGFGDIEKVMKAVGATMKKAYDAGIEIAKIVKDAVDFISEKLGHKDWGVEEFQKENWEERLRETTPKKEKDKPTIKEDGTVSIPNKMLRDLVERGITDINDLTDAVHKEVVKDLPDVTTRQVRDYITDYGKKVNPTADEVQTQINTAKRIGRLLSEVEDLQKMNKAEFLIKYQKPKPDKSKITEAERELKQKIKTLGGEFIGDVAKETKEARTNSQRLEDAKKKVNDSIAKIREEIITKERELKEKQKPLNEDLELARLKESEAALKNLRDKYLPEPKDAFENEKARERVKDRLVDEIIDLNEQINAGEKKAKDTTPKYADDAQLNKLREIKKAKQEVLDILDPRAKEEVRIKSAIKAAEKSLVEYERRLREKDTSPKVKDVKPTTAELDAIREKRDAAKKEYEEFKKTVPKTEAQILSESKQRANTRVKQLETKIKNKDFAKPVNKVKPTDTELQGLQHKKELLQEEFDKEQYKLGLKNRKWWQKAEDAALEVFTGISRTLVAGVDLSATFVQGTWRWFTNPRMSARATGEMFKQFASEKRNAEWFSKLKASGAYEKIKQSKLAVTDEHGRASVKEGLFIVNWANHIYDGLAYLITGGYKPATKFVRQINPIKASQRAFDGYVNYIRVAKFLEVAKEAERDGYTMETDPKIFEGLSNHVNTTTNRGSMGNLETSSKWLSVIMFAPRKVISEIKLFTPYAFLYYAKMPKYVRQKALLDFAKFAGAFVSVNAGIWATSRILQGKGLNDDDDHFWDMSSSDFFTHKFGNTRVNIGGGMKSALVFQGRFFSGNFTDQYGKTTKLGERFGKQINTRWDLALGYGTGKASPGMGVLIKKAQERKGLEVDDAEILKSQVVPMWMQDSKELYKEHPVEIGTLFNILSIFGANVRTVDPSKQSQGNTITLQNPLGINERELTDEEQTKYEKDRDILAEEKIKKAKEKGTVYLNRYGHPTVSIKEFFGKTKKYEDLTDDEIKKYNQSLKEQAADEVRKKIKF